MDSKKISIIVAIIAFLISAGVSYSYFGNTINGGAGVNVAKYTPPKASGDGTAQTTNTNEPATEECPINGKLYPVSQKERWEKRRPLGVMIENHTEARPQSGISSADVVYEAVAEGGITRFLNIFYCQNPSIIGPVRSARIYFIKLLQGYGEFPLYAHVGGAAKEGPADALGEIKKIDWYGNNDMDPLYGMSFPYFYRDYDRLHMPNGDQVATEHTMYSSTLKLWDYAAQKRKLTNVDADGAAWDKGFEKWKFKDDAPMNLRGAVAKVSFGFWDQFANDYGVTWSYSKESNSYKRVNGGVPHLDKNTKKQLEAKNVVVALVKETTVNDGYEKGQHLFYDIIGKGDATIFQDGKAIEGIWNKKNETSQMRFYDTNGKEIQLVRGQVFVEIVPKGNKITY